MDQNCLKKKQITSAPKTENEGKPQIESNSADIILYGNIKTSVHCTIIQFACILFMFSKYHLEDCIVDLRI